MVPEERLGDQPNCGKCHESLFDAHPAALTTASFEHHISRSDIPVLVTTTHTGENAERLVQKLGAAGYISKPLKASDVLSRIKGVVGDERQKGSGMDHQRGHGDEQDQHAPKPGS